MKRAGGIVTGVLCVAMATAACGVEAFSSGRATPMSDRAAAASRESATGTPGTSPSPAVFATGCGEGLVDLSGPLTGSWRANDGGVYYLRQAGDCLWWLGTDLTAITEDGGQRGWSNVAVGRIIADTIYVEWSDVPLGDARGRGTLTLRVSDGGDRIDKVDELRRPLSGGFGGSFWVRVEPEPSASQP